MEKDTREKEKKTKKEIMRLCRGVSRIVLIVLLDE